MIIADINFKKMMNIIGDKNQIILHETEGFFNIYMANDSQIVYRSILKKPKDKIEAMAIRMHLPSNRIDVNDLTILGLSEKQMKEVIDSGRKYNLPHRY